MIGVAGCAHIGWPLLVAFREAGNDARGFDTAPRAHPFITSNSKDFSQGLETLVLAIENEDEAEDLLFGPSGVVRNSEELGRIILVETYSPRYTLGLRDRVPDRIALIDAPASGSVKDADARSLTFCIGGASEDVEDALPLLAMAGTHFHHMGPYGNGMRAKVLNDLLTASNAAMTRLVLDWATKAGLSEPQFLAMIENSTGQNWFTSRVNELETGVLGYQPDNLIGRQVRDVAAAIDGAPTNSDILLPQSVMNALRNLQPRSPG